MKYGGLDYADQRQVRENIDAMFDSLKSQISSIPPQDYVACRTFLQSLLYATTAPPSNREYPYRREFAHENHDL